MGIDWSKPLECDAGFDIEAFNGIPDKPNHKWVCSVSGMIRYAVDEETGVPFCSLISSQLTVRNKQTVADQAAKYLRTHMGMGNWEGIVASLKVGGFLKDDD